MKKNKSKILFSIFVSLCLIKPVYATSKYIQLDDITNIRKGPSTTYERIALGQVGSSYYLKNNNIIADEAKNGKCDSGWYEIDYLGSSGYVCSDYVSLFSESEPDPGVSSTACEAEMQAAGFPSSYWSGLCSLKAAHPNWTFEAVQTKLDFPTAVNKFTNCKDAVVSNPKSEWQDKTCSYSEGEFKPVNQTAVAYYLDPRNFFNEKYIFQFENNEFNNNMYNNYENISLKIIENAAFYKYHLELGNNLPQYIRDGGYEHNVNPTHLASRMYQELGSGTRQKNLYQGTFYGEISYAPENPETGNHIYDYRGLYNFYNINVTGACVTGGGGATYCGLGYAKKVEWNSVPKAVAGGGEFLKNNYITKGQYTSYFERFNVVPVKASSMYVHYYMANLGAPSSESVLAYNSYKANNLLDSSFTFSIPVYSNMGAQINNSGNGAVDSGSSSAPSEKNDIPTIVTSAGYKISNNNLSGIKINTTAKKLIDDIASVGGIATITDNNNASISNGELIGTGFKITIKNANDTKTYTAVLKGDVSGDGKVSSLDMLLIQKYLLGTNKMTDEKKIAADTSRDNEISVLDMLQIQKYILGTYDIEQ